MSVRKEQLSENVTLYCGDAREVVPTLSPVDVVCTDPPYGIKLDVNGARFSGGAASSVSKRGNGKIYAAPIVGDDVEFDPAHLLVAPAVIIWGWNNFPDKLPRGSALIWLKRNDAAFGSFLSDAEIAWFSKGHGTYCFRDLSNAGIVNERVHPTQKPLPLMEWCLERAGGYSVLDPYMGSGTTGVAAVRLCKAFIGIEIEPTYFDAACRRISDELRRPRLFAEPVAKPVQQGLFA